MSSQTKTENGQENSIVDATCQESFPQQAEEGAAVTLANDSAGEETQAGAPITKPNAESVARGSDSPGETSTSAVPAAETRPAQQRYAYGEISASRFQHLRSPRRPTALMTTLLTPSLSLTPADAAGSPLTPGFRSPATATTSIKSPSTPKRGTYEPATPITPILIPGSATSQIGGRAGPDGTEVSLTAPWPAHITWDAKAVTGQTRSNKETQKLTKTKTKCAPWETVADVDYLSEAEVPPSAVSAGGYSADVEGETDAAVTSAKDTDADEMEEKAPKVKSKKKRKYFKKSLASASTLMIQKAFRSPGRKASPQPAPEDALPAAEYTAGSGEGEPEQRSRARHRRFLSEGSLPFPRVKSPEAYNQGTFSEVDASQRTAPPAERSAKLDKFATGMTDILTLGMSAAWRRSRRHSTGSVVSHRGRYRFASQSSRSSAKDTDDGDDDTDFSEAELRRPVSGTSLFATVSELELSPLPRIRLEGRNPSSRELLTGEIAEMLRVSLPPRQRLEDRWRLLYSIEQHGVSMSTMYDHVAGKWALIIAVKDTEDNIFGAYLNEPLRPTQCKYYGTGECFLWKLTCMKGNKTPTGLRVFPWTGRNDYFIIAEPTFFGVGGGNGKFGLWLHQEFIRGTSARVPTYNNEPLAAAEVVSDEDDVTSRAREDFECLEFEVWGIPKDIVAFGD